MTKNYLAFELFIAFGGDNAEETVRKEIGTKTSVT